MVEHDADGAGPLPPHLYSLVRPMGVAFPTVLQRWTGLDWEDVEGLESGGTVNGLTTMDLAGDGVTPPVLAAYGEEIESTGNVEGPLHVWDGTTWSSFNTVPSADEFLAVTTYDADGPGGLPPRLFAARSNTLIEYNGTNWVTRATLDIGKSITNMTAFDSDGAGPNPPVLVVGGDFTRVGSLLIRGLAQWSGTTWSAFGTGISGDVRSLYVDRSTDGTERLVVGGTFIVAGGLTVNRIAAWDGQSWAGFGTGASSTVYSITRHDDDGAGPQPSKLVAAGNFATMGGVQVARIASWDGSDWSPLASGVTSTVSHIISYDDDGDMPNPPSLFVTGAFTEVAGRYCRGLARWSRYSLYGEPDLISPPGGVVNACVQGTAELDASAMGSPPVTYQWFKGEEMLTDGGAIQGSNSPRLIISPAGIEHAATDYRCEIANNFGMMISPNITLAIYETGSGDGTGDGAATIDDVSPFVTALLGLATESDELCAFDLTADGAVDANDIDVFLDLIL